MSATRLVLLLCLIPAFVRAGQLQVRPETTVDAKAYTLGAGDEISIRVLESEDISDKPLRVDPSGEIALPLIGRVHAAGKTLADLETEITDRLKTYLKDPQVSINITEYGSQPISVLGAVTNPGVYQLTGTKTLDQVLALAKGLAPDAGGVIRIASYSTGEAAASGPEALPKITTVRVDDLLSSNSAVGGMIIRPRDVITVPKAQVVYVIGDVHKPGMHVLAHRQSVSALEALSMAEGPLTSAAPQRAKILRRDPNSDKPIEIPIDLKLVLAGRGENLMLRPDDILLVPNNVPRSVALRSLEAAIQFGTGFAIYRH